MNVKEFVNAINADFFCGVPDSQLKPLCDYLMNTYGIDKKHHIIAANEGNCVGIAAGYHLATGKLPVVYLQNSGEGNVINPVASLLNDKVYAIPCLFVIGWRGEPGVHDEPQHIFQGEVTLKLLKDMDIEAFVIDSSTTATDVEEIMKKWQLLFSKGKQAAFVIKKGSLEYAEKVKYENGNSLVREEIIRHIVSVSGSDPIVSTTGKASRELFEIREANGQGHKYDFLTVGSMGHSSSIALGLALNKPHQKVWCVDGDGAVLMHMGSMAVIGASNPENLVHIVLNNGAHETVGGMPTVASGIDLVAIAKACGYRNAIKVSTYSALDEALKNAKYSSGLTLIEVECSISSRKDLGRPTTTALDNKNNFMDYIKNLD
ncbi:MAG: phosphonopyruvate decarboxylase [Clostridia bacterium]|nr:phosphonopyruvate decarboxylase [Clostridia bacterium]